MYMCALKEAAALGSILLRLCVKNRPPSSSPSSLRTTCFCFFSQLLFTCALSATTRYTNKLLISGIILYLEVHQA